MSSMNSVGVAAGLEPVPAGPTAAAELDDECGGAAGGLLLLRAVSAALAEEWTPAGVRWEVFAEAALQASDSGHPVKGP